MEIFSLYIAEYCCFAVPLYFFIKHITILCMLHDTMHDGFWLGSDGAAVMPDIGLEMPRYKDKLDRIIVSNQETYDNGQLSYICEEGGMDEGDYYRMRGVILCNEDSNSNDAGVVLGELEELRVRKDGLFLYKFSDGKVYTQQQIEENKKYGKIDENIYIEMCECKM